MKISAFKNENTNTANPLFSFQNIQSKNISEIKESKLDTSKTSHNMLESNFITKKLENPEEKEVKRETLPLSMQMQNQAASQLLSVLDLISEPKNDSNGFPRPLPSYEVEKVINPKKTKEIQESLEVVLDELKKEVEEKAKENLENKNPENSNKVTSTEENKETDTTENTTESTTENTTQTEEVTTDITQQNTLLNPIPENSTQTEVLNNPPQI